MSIRVPFSAAATEIQARHRDYLEAMAEVMTSAELCGGSRVESFENEFAAFTTTEYVVATNGYSSALMLALRALDIGHGDEVIVPANAVFATAEAVSTAGARPVFADVDDGTLTLNIQSAAAKITKRTRAIIAVHSFGQVASMESLVALANAHGLRVVEDVGAAPGATRNNRNAGAFGDIAVFDFAPSSNLAALGPAGGVATNSQALADRVRCLRDHGQPTPNTHLYIGYGAQPTALLFACLRLQLASLPRDNEKRRVLAARYRDGLEPHEKIRCVSQDRAGSPVYQRFVVRVAKRDAVRKALSDAGIATAIHYPVPIPMQPAYRELGYVAGDFPVAEAAAHEMLSLPIHSYLTIESVSLVIETLRAAVA